MRIGIIVPTRGDRKDFLQNCLKLIYAQSIFEDESIHVVLEIIAYEPLSESCDITQRYRQGYDNLRNKEIDVIAFMEDDDWYSPDYLQTMVSKWVDSGKPDLLGTTYTIYYHVGLFAHFQMNHHSRSSAMSTLIKPDLDFKWCPDNEPYTDIHLWQTLKGVLFTPEKHICLGIKHGVGKCGGKSHVDRLFRYENEDKNGVWLKSVIGEKDFDFYNETHTRLNITSK